MKAAPETAVLRANLAAVADQKHAFVVECYRLLEIVMAAQDALHRV